MDPETSEKGGQDTILILLIFLLDKYNKKFQIKRGGHGPLCLPLNPPLLTDITSGVTFTHPSNQFED